jgi:Asp-tRNA(Asn)/Glu-tRNA(Gln) amidotransferase A subunit family amidase
LSPSTPRAREAADALDAERASGRVRGPLHGVPVLVKDNYETIEMPTAAGSIALASFHPARDAFLVQRLKTAGAVILGKTNMHELAAGIFTVGSRFGQTRNPYDLDRNPGGSSGGTGAAVAANFAAGGMGSDTCGSIRIPASHNNLVGLRGTQGLSSRNGIVPLSSTQDIGGPIARTVADLAIMLDATVGADPADASTTASAGHIPSSYRSALRADALKGARIGVVRSLFGNAPEDQEVTTVVQQALDGMKKAGAETIDVVVPGLDDLLRDSSMINHDFKFDLADYLAEVRRRAGWLARRDSRSRALPQRAREHVPRAKRGRVARERRVAARENQARRAPAGDRGGAVRTSAGGDCVPDAAAEAGEDRRRPGWIDLSGQFALGAAGSRRAGRIYRRRPAGWDRAARGRSSRSRNCCRSATRWSSR